MPRTQSALGRYFFRALAAIVVAGLLFILAGAAWSWHASRTYTVVYRLEAPQRAPSPADLERTAALLTQRLGLLGRDFRLSHAAARAVAPDRVEVSFRARWAPNEALAWATMPCRVEFRLVHPHDPLPEGQVPAGYEVKVYRDQQFLLSKPGDLQTVRHSYAVEQRPALVTEGVQEASIATSGMHKMAVLTFRFGPKDAEAFASMTALNVGRKHGDADRRGDVLPAQADRRPDHGRRGADQRLLPATAPAQAGEGAQHRPPAGEAGGGIAGRPVNYRGGHWQWARSAV